MKDFILADKSTIKVAECKYSRLQKYMEAISYLSDVKQVWLFGDALSDDCQEDDPIGLLFIHTNTKRQFMSDCVMTFTPDLIDIEDDFIASMREQAPYVAAIDIQVHGKLIYDKSWNE